MGQLDGRVALITGAARGQGRSHAVRLAEMGADLVLVDVCADLPTIPYPQPGRDALDETASLAAAAGARVESVIADVRDAAAMADATRRAVDQFGSIDIVVANAGVIQLKPATEITPTDWADVIGINLTGVWNTIAPAIGPMIDRGRGGVISITTSAAGLKGPPNMAHYAASKSGVIGLMRSLSAELGPHSIRVNCLAPTTVDTEMVHWPEAYAMFRPDLDAPGRDDVEAVFTSLNAMPVPWIEPIDVTEALAFVVSDRARYMTGAVLPVDAGTLVK
ncbi:MAG: mycofactocin-coupled SDR family oxidoreductase [Ilumatobacter sp.]|uniref:mycofactocin-coupled SDR family oxidoreductase n=1 Tax=Ilumatobacter sp. TaxID=1967498 RepID=UPI00391C4D1D